MVKPMLQQVHTSVSTTDLCWVLGFLGLCGLLLTYPLIKIAKFQLP